MHTLETQTGNHSEAPDSTQQALCPQQRVTRTMTPLSNHCQTEEVRSHTTKAGSKPKGYLPLLPPAKTLT